MVLTLLAGCGPPAERPRTGEPDAAVPFSTTRDYLTVKRDDGYHPLFIKGVNLGVGVPGTLPGQLAATRRQYRTWFDQMRRAGINTLRIYTLHYPRFYEELARHNRRHPDAPIYLLHGVWLSEHNPTGDLFELTEGFETNIREAVDCAHGNCTIDHRYGKAYGEFEANVSRWIIGWIIGREVTPGEIQSTNDAHPDQTRWEGTAFRVRDAAAAEVWFARRLEFLVGYERRRYGIDRPVSVSTWPTLDPLDHPTENERYSSEDVAQFDLARIEPVDAPGGIFASYHAYPYYPNFIFEDPGYREYSDPHGPNSYLGYLEDLKAHYAELPLVAAEFGVPSSWGNAHSGYQGMNHGGHTEVEQGEAVARMLHNYRRAGLAGGAAFAWIDEWWKRTWITDQRGFPRDRRRLWHNVVAPEQNFGFIAFDLGAPDWQAHSPADGRPPVDRARVTTDAAYLHVRLELTRPLPEDPPLVVGFDTYRDDLGESVLPKGASTRNRNEFALVVAGDRSARHYVMRAYDLVGIWYAGPEDWQEFRSVASDGGPWNLFRLQNGQPHQTPDGEQSWPTTYDDVGQLGIRAADEPATSLDAVVVGPDQIEIRIPWTLLNVTDPSRRRVMHDRLSTPERETAQTEGIALSVALGDKLLFETRRFGWDTWDEAPETTARIKRGLQSLSRAADDLPTWIDPNE